MFISEGPKSGNAWVTAVARTVVANVDCSGLRCLQPVTHADLADLFGDAYLRAHFSRHLIHVLVYSKLCIVFTLALSFH